MQRRLVAILLTVFTFAPAIASCQLINLRRYMFRT
jgi:hypothetical protein